MVLFNSHNNMQKVCLFNSTLYTFYLPLTHTYLQVVKDTAGKGFLKVKGSEGIVDSVAHCHLDGPTTASINWVVVGKVYTLKETICLVGNHNTLTVCEGQDSSHQHL